MAKITRIHAEKSADESGMREYRKKLFMHRAGMGGRIVTAVIVLAVICIALRIWYVNRTYTTYEVSSSVEYSGAVDTSYVEYDGNIIKYSHDGISCITRTGEALWSQTYNMQSPIVDISGKEVAIADKSGNEAYIFNEEGLQTQISTLMPISRISVSSGGVAALLLSDGSSSYIYLYDSEGNELAEIKCSIQETGQPLSMAISPDGARLAVSYLQVQDGQADSCVVFYNFGSVGSNYVDKIVSSKVYSGEIIPRIEYMTNSLCVAVSDQQIIYFEGDEIPEETATVQINTEILSVFFSENRVGIVVDGEDAAMLDSEGEENTVIVTEDDDDQDEEDDEAGSDEGVTEDEDASEEPAEETEEDSEESTEDTDEDSEEPAEETEEEDAESTAQIWEESVRLTVLTQEASDETESGSEEDDDAENDAENGDDSGEETETESESGGNIVSYSDIEDAAKYEIWVFDSNGRQVRTIETDLDYSTVKFSGKSLLIYNDDECEIYSLGGVLKFSGSFDSTVNCIYKITGMQRYVIVYAESMDTVRLQ